MKRFWLLLVIVIVSSVPSTLLAGASPDLSPLRCCDQLDDREMALTSGHGCEMPSAPAKQAERIVIWDEWARSTFIGNQPAATGQGRGTINSGQGQVTVSARN
jgi:hypothetical protein